MDCLETVAIRCAKKAAKKWGVPYLWREYLSSAYLGLLRAKENGIANNKLYLRAESSIKDSLRNENQTRRHSRNRVTKHQLPDDADETVEDYRRQDNPEGNMLLVWRETKPIRKPFNIRIRLYLYLIRMENWLCEDVARYFNVGIATVHRDITRFLRCTLGDLATKRNNYKVIK